jgi:hypothetical protein
MKRSREIEPAGAPGSFTNDGSWREDGELEHRGQVHRLVAAMVRHRRESAMSPASAAAAIEAASAGEAFPNAARWPTASGWPTVPASTAAEETVKRCGRGHGPSTQGHWCGQQWAEEPESECRADGHRPERNPAEINRIVAAIVESLSRP